MKLYTNPRKAEETKYNFTEGNIRNETTSGIKLLPEHIIDQIKAGEVIERPAALIKELVENSVDAGSSQIDVHIIENGLELINVTDNGTGMGFSDLPFAFCRHATSKIETFEDIYKLGSYGFRGEALASVSSISRTTCSSMPADPQKKGGKIVIHGGEITSHTKHESPKHGTSFFVKDLFYNTPARLKFIKSKTSEKNAIKRILNSFLLSNPQIAFSIKWDDKEKQFFPASSDNEFEKRITKVFFKHKNEDGYFHFKEEYEGHKVEGWVSKISAKGSAGKNHYLFCNNRLFTDKQIHQSIMKIMERFWPYGQTGHYCLKITVPPNQVDVNVHPSKTLIKFFKPSVVFSLVSTGLKKSLPQNTPQVTNQELFAPNNMRDQLHDFSANHHAPENSVNYPAEQSHVAYADHSFYFRSLSESISLIKLEDFEHHLLIDTNKAITHYLKQKFNAKISENEIVPLLISEPFHYKNLKIDNYFSLFKELGFEFERLDEEMIVLRTTPEYFTLFDINKVIKAVLDSYIQFGALKELEVKDFVLKANCCQKIIESCNTSVLLEQRCLIILDHPTLSEFFHG